MEPDPKRVDHLHERSKWRGRWEQAELYCKILIIFYCIIRICFFIQHIISHFFNVGGVGGWVGGVGVGWALRAGTVILRKWIS